MEKSRRELNERVRETERRRIAEWLTVWAEQEQQSPTARRILRWTAGQMFLNKLDPVLFHDDGYPIAGNEP